MDSGARPSSPSGLSTTSSDSPLVRQGSSASSISTKSSATGSTLSTATAATVSAPTSRPSSRRFEPTCIAAAQLRLHELEGQQQQSASGNTKPPNGNKLAQIGAAAKYINSNKNHDSANQMENKCQKQAASKSKSIGYNVAKAVAFRANSFGNFWSVNKMRYMNLACLLMTLVCLLTILLVSNNNSNSMDRSGHSRHWQQQHMLVANNGQPHGESLQHSDRQPLVGRPKFADDDELESGIVATGEPDLFDDRLEAEPSASSDALAPKLAAKVSSTGQLDPATSGGGQPMDENEERDEERVELGTGKQKVARLRPVQLGGSLLDQMFEDFDRGLGGLLAKSVASRNQLAEASANATSRPRTIIRRVIRNGNGDGIGGATIIITTTTSGSLGGPAKNGSSSGSNATASDAITNQALPMLLERLIPPLLRPLGMMGSSIPDPLVGLLPPRRPPGGFMMSTFGPAEPMMLGSQRPMAGSALYAIPPPPLGPYGGAQQMALGGGSPAFVSMGGGMMAAAPPFFPGSSLIGAMMQQIAQQKPSGIRPITEEELLADENDYFEPKPKAKAQQQQPQTNGSQVHHSGSSPPPRPALELGAGKPEDPIQGQASGQTELAKSSNSSGSGNSASGENPDDEFETFDVTASRPQATPAAATRGKASKRPLSGGASMIVISSSHMGPELPQLMGPLAASMGQSSSTATIGEPETGAPMAGALRPLGASPILRAILGNLMSDLAGSSSQAADRNSSSSLRGFIAGRRNSSPGWPVVGDLVREMEDNDEDMMQSQHGQQDQAGELADQRRRQPRGRLDDTTLESTKDQQQPDGESSQPRVSFADLMNGGTNRLHHLQQFDQSPSSFVDQLIESAANGAHGSGAIRQIFRGPTLSLERVIELPSFEEGHRQQLQHNRNPLDGVRSQSISSRASHQAEPEVDEADEIQAELSGRMLALQQQPPKRMPFARIVFGPDGAETVSQHQQQPSPAVGHLIGRLLDDLRHGPSTVAQNEQQASGRIANRLDDLEEGDSMDLGAPKEQPIGARAQLPPTGPWLPPRVRVATARIRISPMAAHRREMATLMSSNDPSHAPPSPTTSSLLAGDNQKQQPAFAGHHQEELNGSGAEPVFGQQQPKRAEQRHDDEDEYEQDELQMPKKEKVSLQMKTIQQADSPFTSPSSPLFGFPFMVTSGLKSNKQPLAGKANVEQSNSVDSKEQQAVVATPQGSNRRQRAFVYHSNHEVATGAPSLLSAQESAQGRSNEHHNHQQQELQLEATGNEHQQHEQASSESIGGPRFALPPPAAVVMGRRLDDGPFAAVDHQEPGNPVN